jgi:hypothetical protein
MIHHMSYVLHFDFMFSHRVTYTVRQSRADIEERFKHLDTTKTCGLHISLSFLGSLLPGTHMSRCCLCSIWVLMSRYFRQSLVPLC